MNTEQKGSTLSVPPLKKKKKEKEKFFKIKENNKDTYNLSD